MALDFTKFNYNSLKNKSIGVVGRKMKKSGFDSYKDFKKWLSNIHVSTCMVGPRAIIIVYGDNGIDDIDRTYAEKRNIPIMSVKDFVNLINESKRKIVEDKVKFKEFKDYCHSIINNIQPVLVKSDMSDFDDKVIELYNIVKNQIHKKYPTCDIRIHPHFNPGDVVARFYHIYIKKGNYDETTAMRKSIDESGDHQWFYGHIKSITLAKDIYGGIGIHYPAFDEDEDPMMEYSMYFHFDDETEKLLEKYQETLNNTMEAYYGRSGAYTGD